VVQAEQASRARTRFLAAASHDLRQPLHAMGLFIDSLIHSATDAQRPAILRLQEGTQVMGGLLDALLDISRLDANVVSPHLETVVLDELFSQIEAMHGPAAAEAGVQLRYIPSGKAVSTDRVLVLRVLGNLAQNAIHHNPGSRVVMVARREGSRVRLEVRDNGIGIASIHQTRIFEEFYQVTNPERDRRKGFGLGLSICSRLASLLGSTITVKSQLKQGSVFSVSLPREDIPTTRPTTAAPAPAAQLLPLDCLVIDDNPAILDGMQQLLSLWGCRVQSAATGSQALARLREPGRRYQVILCDLQLSENEDGMTIIEHARRLQPGALTVLISGATTSAVLQRVQQIDITLLTKPVAPAKLRALLAGVKPGAA
jgi:CheY-like chemotaxis protein